MAEDSNKQVVNKDNLNPAAVELGRLGGRTKTKAKSNASRKNGALGGRPKKK